MSELTFLDEDVTKGDTARALYDREFIQQGQYITIAATKDFNGVSLFSTNILNVTLDSEGATFAMNGIDLNAAAYTGAINADISTTTAAVAALGEVKAAICHLASDRATIGTYKSRLNSTSDHNWSPARRTWPQPTLASKMWT